MNEQNALIILKGVLDLATQKGCFENLQAAAVAANAYNVIAKKFVPELNQVQPTTTQPASGEGQ